MSYKIFNKTEKFDISIDGINISYSKYNFNEGYLSIVINRYNCPIEILNLIIDKEYKLHFSSKKETKAYDYSGILRNIRNDNEYFECNVILEFSNVIYMGGYYCPYIPQIII